MCLSKWGLLFNRKKFVFGGWFCGWEEEREWLIGGFIKKLEKKKEIASHFLKKNKKNFIFVTVV